MCEIYFCLVTGVDWCLTLAALIVRWFTYTVPPGRLLHDAERSLPALIVGGSTSAGTCARSWPARTLPPCTASPARDLAVPAPTSESVETPGHRRKSASVVVSRLEVGGIDGRDGRAEFGERTGDLRPVVAVPITGQRHGFPAF